MAIVPIYSQPDLIYGQGTIYRQLDGVTGLQGLSQPHRRAYTIRVYDRKDLLQEIISSNSGQGYLVSMKFELLDSGCGSFEIELTKRYAIDHGYRVDIHLWNDPLPWYSGFVQEPQIPGGTNRTWTYQGYGGTALFDRVLVTKTYPGQKVHLIAQDLFKQAEIKQKRISYDESQIDASKFSTVSELKCLNTPLKTVLKQVANLAGGYVYGVDERRRMFFKKPSNNVDMHAWVGKHIETSDPRSDSSKIVNSMRVKAGKVRIDISSTSIYYKTNWVQEPLEHKGKGSSQELYGVCEGVYSAPNVLSLIDAMRAAAVELKRLKDPKVSNKVRSFIFKGDRVSCEGKARIIGADGSQLILDKKKFTFTIRGSKVELQGDLGELERAPGNVIMDLAARTELETMARQQSQNQL